mgnify:CR=1 FL=1
MKSKIFWSKIPNYKMVSLRQKPKILRKMENQWINQDQMLRFRCFWTILPTCRTLTTMSLSLLRQCRKIKILWTSKPRCKMKTTLLSDQTYHSWVKLVTSTRKIAFKTSISSVSHWNRTLSETPSKTISLPKIQIQICTKKLRQF